MGKGLIVAGVAVLLALLVFIALRKSATLYDALPPRFEHDTAFEAQAAAYTWSLQHGGSVRGILGTGSMSYRNYIPAAPEGVDPRSVVVAYFVLNSAIRFDQIQAGDLCLYRWANYENGILHQAADFTSDGWIMAGNANGAYDGLSNRMTADNFKGIATAVFVHKGGRQ